MIIPSPTLFSLCCSDWIISIDPSSRLLPLSSIVSILLLNPSNEFSIWLLYFHFYSLHLFFSILSVSLLKCCLFITFKSVHLECWGIFIIAALKSLSDNFDNCVISALASVDYLTHLEIFLVLHILSHFGLYFGHFDNYVLRLWLLFKSYGDVDFFKILAGIRLDWVEATGFN